MQRSILKFSKTKEISPTHRRDSLPRPSEYGKVVLIHAGLGDLTADGAALFRPMRSSRDVGKRK